MRDHIITTMRQDFGRAAGTLRRSVHTSLSACIHITRSSSAPPPLLHRLLPTSALYRTTLHSSMRLIARWLRPALHRHSRASQFEGQCRLRRHIKQKAVLARVQHRIPTLLPPGKRAERDVQTNTLCGSARGGIQTGLCASDLSGLGAGPAVMFTKTRATKPEVVEPMLATEIDAAGKAQRSGCAAVHEEMRFWAS